MISLNSSEIYIWYDIHRMRTIGWSAKLQAKPILFCYRVLSLSFRFTQSQSNRTWRPRCYRMHAEISRTHPLYRVSGIAQSTPNISIVDWEGHVGANMAYRKLDWCVQLKGNFPHTNIRRTHFPPADMTLHTNITLFAESICSLWSIHIKQNTRIFTSYSKSETDVFANTRWYDFDLCCVRFLCR